MLSRPVTPTDLHQIPSTSPRELDSIDTGETVVSSILQRYRYGMSPFCSLKTPG